MSEIIDRAKTKSLVTSAHSKARFCCKYRKGTLELTLWDKILPWDAVLVLNESPIRFLMSAWKRMLEAMLYECTIWSYLHT